MRHDFYRPFAWQRFKAGLDAQGRVVARDSHAVRHQFRKPVPPKGRSSLYPVRFIPNYRLELSVVDGNLPGGPYRSPGANASASFIEGFIDELAHAAGQDPLAFRLALLGEDRELKQPDFSTTRMKAVLRLAAEKAGSGQPLPRGRGRGVAAYYAHQGYVAEAVAPARAAARPALDLKVTGRPGRVPPPQRIARSPGGMVSLTVGASCGVMLA